MNDVFRDRLRRARDGDREALDQILGAHRERIRTIVRRRLGGQLREVLESSDLIQSACFDAIRGINDVQETDEEGFVGWIARIVETTIRDKFRFFNARKRQWNEVEPLQSQSTEADEPTPSRVVGEKERIDLVLRVLATLPSDYRRAIELVRIERRSHEEAALAMNRSAEAMRMLLARARARLLEALEREVVADE